MINQATKSGFTFRNVDELKAKQVDMGEAEKGETANSSEKGKLSVEIIEST